MEKKQSIWQEDITHHMVGVLAVFGLIVSSVVATAGVAALGVDTQVAFAQNEVLVSQTAVALEAAKHPDPAILMRMASTSARMASSTALYCPKIADTIARGGKDATTTGSVSELQRFIASRYGLEASSSVTGYFGSTTANYLEKFQQEQGIPPAPMAGALTRAAIVKLCAGDGRPPMMASTTPPMMGTTTRPQEPPRGDMRPKAPTSTNNGVSIQTYEGTSNAAAVVEAINQIGEGYSKLIGATLSLLGL